MIEYNEFQRSEDCAREIYSELKKIPLQIREHLQRMIEESPIAVKEFYFDEAIKRCSKKRVHSLDISDLEDSDD